MRIHQPFRLALVGTLGVGLGLVIIGGIETLSAVWLYIGTSLFIALGLEPIVRFFMRRGLVRWAAVLVTILIVLAAFAGIVLMVLPIIVGQVTDLIGALTRYIQAGTLVEDVMSWLHSVAPGLSQQAINGALTNMQNWLVQNFGTITGGVINAGIALFSGLTGAVIVLVLTIYFTASIPSLLSAMYSLVPASKRERFIDLSSQITDSVGYYVMGQASLGAINGVLSAILLTVIHAPFPAVLAVVAFFFSLIPLVGTLTGSAIIVLTCLIPGLGSPTTALIAGIYYIIYMQVEAYLISPRIMSRAVSVPGAVVVIAALAGGSLLGLLGALVAIPVAASILIIYRQVIIPRQNEL